MTLEGGSEFTRVFLVDVGSEAEVEGDRLFGSHKKWMEATHPRDGALALLHYSVAKGTDSITGKVGYLLLEIYASPEGVDNHHELAKSWEDVDAFRTWVHANQIVALDKPVVVKSIA